MDCGNVHAMAATGDGRTRVQVPDGAQGVLLQAYWDDVALTSREGVDLVITLLDGRELVLDGYFSSAKEGEESVLIMLGGSSGEVPALHISADGGIVFVERIARSRLEEMFGSAPADIDETLAQSETSGGGGLNTTWIVVGGLVAVGVGALLLSDDDEEDSERSNNLSLLRAIGVRGADTASAEDAERVLKAYESLYGAAARSELREEDNVGTDQQVRIQGLLFIAKAYGDAGDEADFEFEENEVIVKIDYDPLDLIEVNEQHTWRLFSYVKLNRIDVAIDANVNGTTDIEFSFPLNEFEHGLIAKFDIDGTPDTTEVVAYDGDEDNDPNFVFERIEIDADSALGANEYALTDRLAGFARGVEEVSFEGSASTTLSLTADQLLLLQDQRVGIVIRFESSADNDAVMFTGGGVAGADSDVAGYEAYTATVGPAMATVLIDADITVTGAA